MTRSQRPSRSPKANAAQFIDTVIARYQSAAQKRLAVRNALAARPNDPRLAQIEQQLNSRGEIRSAAIEGVFINYTRPDELHAIELAHHLKTAGLKVWLDMIDVRNGSDWYDEVDAAMERSGLMISIMSTEALQNDVAIFERHNFDLSGKLVLPVIFSHCDTSAFNRFWLTPIDFSHDFSVGLHNLFRALNVEPALA